MVHRTMLQLVIIRICTLSLLGWALHMVLYVCILVCNQIHMWWSHVEIEDRIFRLHRHVWRCCTAELSLRAELKHSSVALKNWRSWTKHKWRASYWSSFPVFRFPVVRKSSSCHMEPDACRICIVPRLQLQQQLKLDVNINTISKRLNHSKIDYGSYFEHFEAPLDSDQSNNLLKRE